MYEINRIFLGYDRIFAATELESVSCVFVEVGERNPERRQQLSKFINNARGTN